jgi:hypothetical protein
MTEIEALEGGAPTLVERAGAAFDKFARAAKPVVHYGFVPFVIIVGMSLEPRPSLLSLIQII